MNDSKDIEVFFGFLIGTMCIINVTCGFIVLAIIKEVFLK